MLLAASHSLAAKVVMYSLTYDLSFQMTSALREKVIIYVKSEVRSDDEEEKAEQ